MSKLVDVRLKEFCCVKLREKCDYHFLNINVKNLLTGPTDFPP
jgi:hypothetical protein